MTAMAEAFSLASASILEASARTDCVKNATVIAAAIADSLLI
jgi:hypothetical protein